MACLHRRNRLTKIQHMLRMFSRLQRICRNLLTVLTVCSLSQVVMVVRNAQPQKVPETLASAVSVSVENTNPNYAKIQEYGRIEWHGDTARLVAGGSRPLNFVALTLSSCFGATVNSEDPRYRYLGELLDVTAPQWATQHPDHHVYAAKPAKVDITFKVGSDGSPADLLKLLQEAVQQVNQQQPYGYQVYVSGSKYRPIYSFVPTTSHNETGVLEQTPAYLDQKITIRRQTTALDVFAKMVTDALTVNTGQHFSCCWAFVPGPGPVDGPTITYQATDQPARAVLEDLFGEGISYGANCEPMDNRFCFISAHSDMHRMPETAPQRGVCTALGYDGYPAAARKAKSDLQSGFYRAKQR